MKPLAVTVLALCFASAASAATDPFAGFRIPDHTWQSGTVQADAMAGWSRSNTTGSGTRSDAQDAGGRISLYRSRDSERIATKISIDLAATLRANSFHDDEALSGSTADGRGQDANESWRLAASTVLYPWRAPVGIGASAYGDGVYRQYVTRSDRVDDIAWYTPPYTPGRQERRERNAVHQYVNDAGLSLLAGFGRVRDATVVYDVYNLETRLRETGALARPLSATAKQKLAALLAVAPAYAAAHDRPDRFVWREVERILSEDGALGEHGLDAYSLLRAREPYEPRRTAFARLRGVFVGPYLGARHYHRLTRNDTEFDERDYQGAEVASRYAGGQGEREWDWYDTAVLGGQAEYHRPLGWRWQADVTGTVDVSVRPGTRGLDAGLDARLAWSIADRWSADLRVDQARRYMYLRQVAGGPADDTWDVGCGATLAYYLEDRTTISVTLVETQYRSLDRGFSPAGRSYYRKGQAQLGLTYRFLGWLQAPGLVEPVRAIR